MTIVADTSILIDQLRGHEPARRALARALEAGDRLCASVMTKIEILAGMRASEVAATRALLNEIEWISVDDPLAERAGALAARYVRSHPGVAVADYVIAATVEQLAAHLWTLNRKHFPMFPDLPDPYRSGW